MWSQTTYDTEAIPTPRTDQIDHYLPSSTKFLTFRCERLCRISTVQIQPNKNVLRVDHADYPAPTRPYQLHHKIGIRSASKYLHHEAENRSSVSGVNISQCQTSWVRNQDIRKPDKLQERKGREKRNKDILPTWYVVVIILPEQLLSATATRCRVTRYLQPDQRGGSTTPGRESPADRSREDSLIRYELVHAQNPKFRQPPMPHAIATRVSQIWYHADRHEQWKRVTAKKNVKGRKNDASAENVSRPITSLQRGQQ